MPNPISKVAKNASILIGNAGVYPLSNHPNLAALAAECIGTWSNVESFMLGLYVEMAGGNSSDAAAIYLNLETTSAKNNAVQTLSERKLSNERSRALSAIIGLTKTHQKERDRLAHWVWGESPALPDALLLIDPRVLAKIDFTEKNSREKLRDNTFVYLERDFKSIIKSNNKICSHALTFRQALVARNEAIADAMIQEISSSPEIKERMK